MTAPDSPVTTVLERLVLAKRSGSGWTARCPAHTDGRPSLKVDQGDDGRALLHCYAGCDPAAIVEALGLTMTDTFARDDRASGPAVTRATSQRITYDYHDTSGNLVYQEVRDPPKRFWLRRPDGTGGWIANMHGVERVLWNRPELIARADEPVFLAEGCKDAARLRALGLLATTAANGASATWLESYSEALRGRDVAILADNDAPGIACAEKRAEALSGVAEGVKIILLPGLPAKGDVSDWLDAGHTRTELIAIVTDASEWTPETTDAAHSHVVRLADVKPERLDWLSPGRLAAGKLTVLDGDPGLGKSTLLCDWAARVSTGQPLPDGEPGRPRGVVLLSAEDGLGDTIRPRLEAAGAELARVVALPAVPDGTLEGRFPELPLDVAYIRGQVDQHDVALLIIDPLMAYLGSGVNSWRDQDVRRALAPLASMADATGCAVVLVRHLNKAPGGNALYRGGGSIGIIGAARCGLLVAADPDNEERRVLASTKSNLAKPPESIAFRLEPVAGSDVARVVYVGSSVHSAHALLAPPEGTDESPARSEAESWLRDHLANGPVSAKDAIKAARADGISERTMKRARSALGVISERTGGLGNAGGWSWSLPEGLAKGATPPKDAVVGHDGPLSEMPDAIGFFEDKDPKGAKGAIYISGGPLSEVDRPPGAIWLCTGCDEPRSTNQRPCPNCGATTGRWFDPEAA